MDSQIVSPILGQSESGKCWPANRKLRHYTGVSLWTRIETVLVCICMTPIPYLLLAWLLWLACSSQHYAPMY
jgi:hypothetical protein